MKNEIQRNLLLALAVVFVGIYLFRDFDPALLGAAICVAMYAGLGRKNDKGE